MKKSLSMLTLTVVCYSAVGAVNSGIELNHFDRNVRFQDNLFQAVNGQWINNTAIPADQSAYGAFHQLRNINEQRCRELIEQIIQADTQNAEQRKISALYRSFMNEERLEELGIQPLNADIAEILALRTHQDLISFLGKHQASPFALPLTLRSSPDAQNSSAVLLQITQDGLGLPARSYYLQDTLPYLAAREAYKHYLTTLFTLAGLSEPSSRAQEGLNLETQIAEAQWSLEDNRDQNKTYNKINRDALQRTFADIDWELFLRKAQINRSITQLNIMQPSYIRQLQQLMQTQSLQSWQNYLLGRLLSTYAPFLTKKFVKAYFAFEYRALSGVDQLPERWKLGVELVNASIGNELGKLYVAKYFTPETKEKVEGLANNLINAFATSLRNLEWMTANTRKAAQEKLAKYRIKIGYPNKWRDYRSLTIQEDDLVSNIRQINAFDYQDMLSQIGRPVDREKWEIMPQTVNAYYAPTLNEIVFPAGILQVPFYNPNADDAVNYGAIGAIIGHEISHGFDDQGSKYDGDGNLRNWWSSEDRQRFNALTTRLVTQYAAYEALVGHPVNGRLTLGENIADNSGLQIAYKAYRESLNGRAAAILDGFSGDQRFFIGFAQIWRTKIRDTERLKLLALDPHAPPQYRLHGVIVNTDAFYDAFNVREGDLLYKPIEQRIRIW